MKLKATGVALFVAASTLVAAPTASASVQDAPCSSQASAFTYTTNADGTYRVTITNCSYYSQNLGVKVSSGGTVIGVQGCGWIAGKGSATRNVGFRPVSVVTC